VSWINRLANVFRSRIHRDLDDELTFHIESRARDNMAQGMAPANARRDAIQRLGNPALTRERTRDADILVWAESLGQDVRYAFRGLRRNPGFTVLATLALALGIGANTAIFSIVRGVLLRPLPFSESAQLQMLTLSPRRGPFGVGQGLADRAFLAFQRSNHSFESVATFSWSPTTLTGAGDPVRLKGVYVTGTFWHVLRAEPAASPDRTVALSDGLWRSRFAADPAIAGRPIMLDGVEQRIAGVMPPGFNFPTGADLWILREIRLDPGNSLMAPVIGRLRAGVTPQQAQQELRAMAARELERGYNPNTWVAEVLPLKELLIGKFRNSLLVFAGAVAFVMLIACANFANLLLIRAASRGREIAARAALGAGRGRLVRQLLTESTLLSAIGGIAGLLFASRAVPLLLALSPEGRIPRVDEIRIDPVVLLFAVGMSLVTGLVFGIAPALHATGRLTHSTTRRGEGLRGSLAIAEIGLALVLVTGGGLLLQSFLRMAAVNPGFNPDRVFAMSVILPRSVYREARQMQVLHQRIVEQLGQVPGVAAASAVNWMPLGGNYTRGDFVLEGGRPQPPHYVVDKPVVMPAYFRAMGMTLQAGRDFSALDTADAPGVVIVSESVARQLWPGESALGKRLSMEDRPKPQDWLTVVGVVNDVHQDDLAGQPHAAIYQTVPQVKSRGFLAPMTYVARASSDGLPLTAAMRDVLRSVDPNQPSESIAPVSSLVSRVTAEPRFRAWLIGILSVLALLLAAIGVYAVLACSVAQRTREIGIRMALGARPADVLRLILYRTAGIAIAGVAIGAAGALALTGTLDKLLFDIKPGDPATFVAGAILLTAVALLAALIPARRAAGLDPLLTIRHE
jgi:putative ABC transport system permease protein